MNPKPAIYHSSNKSGSWPGARHSVIIFNAPQDCLPDVFQRIFRQTGHWALNGRPKYHIMFAYRPGKRVQILLRENIVDDDVSLLPVKGQLGVRQVFHATSIRSVLRERGLFFTRGIVRLPSYYSQGDNVPP